MSVVNQMLQELDRRRAPFAERHRLPPELRPLPPAPRAGPVSPPVAAGGALALIVAGAIAGWVWWYRPAPAEMPAPAPAATTLAPVREAAGADPAAVTPPATGIQPAPLPVELSPARTGPLVPPPQPSREQSVEPALAAASVPAKPASPAAPTALPAAAAVVATAQPAIEKAAPAVTPRDQADESYRRALEDLALGRSAEAANSLRQALRQDPAFLDARLALARLLVDQGDGPAAGDLLRAGARAGAESAEYQGLFAAVLQRLGRHDDAVTRYEAALRLMPSNAVWWMGLGISLEGANRRPEARDAFLRAQSAGSLAGDLAAFVEGKLRQLP